MIFSVSLDHHGEFAKEKEEVSLMGHIELLEFYGLRLMVLLTLRDFDGIYQNHRSPYEGLGVRWFIWLIIPTKEDESNNTRLSLNFFVELHNIFKDKVKNGKRLRDKIFYYTLYVQLLLFVSFMTLIFVSEQAQCIINDNQILVLSKIFHILYWIGTMEMFTYF